MNQNNNESTFPNGTEHVECLIIDGDHELTADTHVKVLTFGTNGRLFCAGFKLYIDEPITLDTKGPQRLFAGHAPRTVPSYGQGPLRVTKGASFRPSAFARALLASMAFEPPAPRQVPRPKPGPSRAKRQERKRAKQARKRGRK